MSGSVVQLYSLEKDGSLVPLNEAAAEKVYKESLGIKTQQGTLTCPPFNQIVLAPVDDDEEELEALYLSEYLDKTDDNKELRSFLTAMEFPRTINLEDPVYPPRLEQLRNKEERAPHFGYL